MGRIEIPASACENNKIFTNVLKKRLFYPLTIVQGHQKIVPSYSAIQIRKSQEIPEYYLKNEVITNVFAKAGLWKPGR